MKLSVSAYRAHASAHKKILDTAYNLNYGSVSASHLNNTQQSSAFKVSQQLSTETHKTAPEFYLQSKYGHTFYVS